MKFGQWLAAERKRKAFTQDSFAVAAGYSQAMISKIENGGDITREFCAAAAKALGLSEEEVLSIAGFAMVAIRQRDDLADMVAALGDDDRAVVRAVVVALRDRRKKSPAG